MIFMYPCDSLPIIAPDIRGSIVYIYQWRLVGVGGWGATLIIAVAMGITNYLNIHLTIIK